MKLFAMEKTRESVATGFRILKGYGQVMSDDIYVHPALQKPSEKGFSLVELVIVIAIIGILLSIGTIAFNDWTKKYNIEKQTKELFSVINDARLRSIHSKKRHGIVLNPSQYVMRNYSSENENRLAGRTILTKTVQYPLMKNSGGGTLAGDLFIFDTRGFIDNGVGITILVNPANSGAAQDCIVLSEGRTNMGKLSNGVCGY